MTSRQFAPLAAALPSSAFEIFRSASFVVETFTGGCAVSVRKLGDSVPTRRDVLMQDQSAVDFLLALDAALDSEVNSGVIDAWLSKYRSTKRRAH